MDDEVPLTPVSRLCIRPEHNTVILCAIGFTNTINIDALKEEISNFVLVKIPRFSSLVVYDHFDGSLNWKPTRVNVDDHVFIHSNDDEHQYEDGKLSEEDIINSYLADMITSPPLSLDKPLWELHVMPKYKFIIMRVHHALGDGMSLMSMLWTMGRPKEDQIIFGDDMINGGIKHSENVKNDGHNTSVYITVGRRVWGFLVYIWYHFIFGLNYLTKFVWLKDEVKKISGNKSVDLSRRNVATVTFSLDDMKSIKRDIPNATIHDALYGIVWCGLTRYLNAKHPQALKHGTQITGLCPVHVRKQPGLQDLSTMLSENSKTPWGNKFTMILLPIIHYTKKHDLDPLTYVKRAKSVMDKKKRYMEGRLSYKVECIATQLIGSKIPSWFLAKLFQNSTFILSNIVGPQKEIFVADNPVSFIRLTASSNKPQAVAMHMVSYMGRADIQIQVAKDIFTDAEFLVKCFKDSLFDMMKAA